MPDTGTQGKTAEPDLIAKLAARGEKALGELDRIPGGKTAVKTAGQLRERAEELHKRVSGVDRLEQRLAGIEARLIELEHVLGVKPPAVSAPEPTPAPDEAA